MQISSAVIAQLINSVALTTNKMGTTIQLTHKSPISEKLLNNLAFFCDGTGQFVSVLFKNPIEWFSPDSTQMEPGCVKSGKPCVSGSNSFTPDVPFMGHRQTE